MDPSGYFFFEKQSLIDFQIGKGRKRDFPRGRAAIFSTQRILRGRDPILSIQRINENFRAAELRFSLHKEFRAAGIRILSTQRIGGGDLEENGNFPEGKRAAL